MKNSITVGSFEVVSLPELGLNTIIAKVDTGAYSGAVHCTNIVLTQNGKDGTAELSFVPAGNSTLSYKTTDFARRRVRASTGHQIERYIIKTTIVIKGISYQTEIGLSDRSDMKKQILIGRRFLRQQQMLVDVTQNTEYDDEGELQL